MWSRRCRDLIVVVVIAAAAPAQGQVVVSPHLDAKVAGDVETERGGVGLSVGYYLRGRLGLGVELDAAWHGHFFRDEDVADLVPDGVDLNTDALLVAGNLVLAVPIPRAPIWRPYATAGVGVTHAVFDARGADEYDTDQDDITINAGVGVMHRLNWLLGLRVDARYYRAFADEDGGGGYREDYDFWRISVGITFGFPPTGPPDPGR
jgi:hypothetical protein